MATTFEFTISCRSLDTSRADGVLARAHEQVNALENELSEYLIDSPVFILNHAAPGVEIGAPSSLLELLVRSEHICAATGGSFDCTAKSKPRDVEERNARVGWSLERKTVWRMDAGARLGFGAIGKGYALDQVRRLFEGRGFGDYLLVAGGSSIVLSGFAGPGQPWVWDWSWGRNDQGERTGLRFTHHKGGTIAIGVSGTDEKGAHILDPHQAAPAQKGLTSSLVAHASAADADALSTAVFAGGWERGIEASRSLTSDVAVAAIDQEQVPMWNKVFQNLWGPIAGALVVLLSSEWTARAQEGAEEAVDLGPSSPSDNFNPYLFERSHWWLLLPVFVAIVILLHLKKIRNPRKQKNRSPFS